MPHIRLEELPRHESDRLIDEALDIDTARQYKGYINNLRLWNRFKILLAEKKVHPDDDRTIALMWDSYKSRYQQELDQESNEVMLGSNKRNERININDENIINKFKFNKNCKHK